MGSVEKSRVTSRNVVLNWSKPNTSCRILNYTVVYHGAVLWGSNLYDNGTIATNDTKLNITDLNPFTNYSLRIAAATDAGEGLPKEDKFTTAEDGQYKKWVFPSEASLYHIRKEKKSKENAFPTKICMFRQSSRFSFNK